MSTIIVNTVHVHTYPTYQNNLQSLPGVGSKVKCSGSYYAIRFDIFLFQDNYLDVIILSRSMGVVTGAEIGSSVSLMETSCPKMSIVDVEHKYNINSRTE